MYLKRLELHGFKSFSEKIKLEFNEGVTAVVGPNGSGKSNISDALRWVLGEQSAKSLRGAKMEDVIFAGTEHRRPLGFAEASIVLDNADNKLPLAFAEVKITRKMFRSGESEYMINGVICRLKDVHELFMDTGIGRDGYSIIGQGRVEEILNARAEDRRLLFEEAAGIAKYRSRKQEAQAKLLRQRQNLVRVNDIIGELSARLEPLSIQAEEARLYLERKERLKLVQVNLFLYETRRIESELQQIHNNTSDLSAQEQAESIRSDELKSSIDELKRASDRLNEDAKRANDRQTELKLLAERNGNSVKLACEQIQNAHLDIERMETERSRKRDASCGLEQTITQNNGKLAAITTELAEKRDELAAKEKAADALDEEVSGMEREIERHNAGLIERLRLVAETREAVARLHADYEQTEARKERVSEELARNTQEFKERTEGMRSLQTRLSNLNSDAEGFRREISVLNERRTETAARTQTLTTQRADAVKMLNEAASRFKALSELEKSYEGYYKSVKAVLTQKEKNPERFAGICGPVGGLLETDPAYDTAIDTALGAAVQHIVTKTEDDAQRAIEYLKSARAGRATFLPLTAAQPRELGSERTSLLNEPGALGVAKELVRYDPAYERVISGLLGRVIVADRMDNAIGIYKKYRYSYKIVTTEGELLNVGGAITGGSQAREASSVMGRGREIAKLKETVLNMEGHVAELDKQIESQEGLLRIIDGRLADATAQLHENAVETAAVTQNASQAEKELAALAEMKTALEAENAGLMDRLVETNTRVRSLEQELASAQKDIDAAQDTIARLQDDAAQGRQAKAGRGGQLTALKVDISALEQQSYNMEAELGRLSAELAAMRDEVLALEEQTAGRRGFISEKEAEIAGLERDALAVASQQSALAGQEAALEAAKMDALAKLAETERENEEAAALANTLLNELTRLGLIKERLESDRSKLYDEMWDEYSLTAQSALPYQITEERPEALKREERSLKSEISKMGAVNVGAIEEHRETRRRHDEMAAQRDDILEAEDKLKSLEDELTQLMDARFREQFALISKSFSTVFKQMFGGGKACLKLADERNALDSGIDIVAQPPGKTLQSISLLSGGERSLTATALLFGILLLKPSPFCVLDEVDAALDDSNAACFASFIKNFARDTQFILITHRKPSMEAANVLYGVTMQEHGVSKLVSVSFEDVAV